MYIPPPKVKSKDFLRLKAIAYALLIVALPCCIFLFACEPKSKLENQITNPPELYDKSINEKIPDSQQLLIPSSAFTTDEIELNDKDDLLTQFRQLPHWESPVISLNNEYGQLYTHLDFAGIQNTRKNAEIYILPICHLGPYQAVCPLNNTSLQEHNYLVATTKKNTEYQSINGPSSKTWYYYAKDFNGEYLISTPVQNVSFLVIGHLPKEYQSKWVRLSFLTDPISHTKSNYFLQNWHATYFKFLLILVPIIACMMFLHYRSFESTRILITGSLALTFYSLCTLVWDLHYMVISCLIMAIACVFYLFSNSYFRLIYLFGFLMMAGFSLQLYGSLNKDFLMKIGMPLLIGFALFLSN